MLKSEKQKSTFIAAIWVLILFIFAGICFDFYYDFNDDILLKDIFAGLYSGGPDAHSIQVVYLLGCVFSLLYSLVPAVPWFGLFLLVGTGICLWIFFQRTLLLCSARKQQIGLLLVGGILFFTLLLRETVYIQYTVVSGLFAVAAVVLFLTTPRNLSVKEFWIQNVGSVVLAVLCYYLRPKMLFCMAPFIAAAGILHWSREKQIFTKQNFQKYLGVVGVILLGLILGVVSEKIGYGSSQWKEFDRFYAAREQVYDFSWYPAYEGAEDFYGQIGMNETAYQLVDSYNFALDEAIDTDTLNLIGAYGEKQRLQPDFLTHVKEAVWELTHRIQFPEDVPYNYVVALTYVILLIGIFLARDKSYLWKLPMILAFRCVPWLYVIYIQRAPERVTRPMYIMELVLLLVLIMQEYRLIGERDTARINIWGWIAGGLLGVVALFFLPASISKVQAEQLQREEINSSWIAFNEYTREHPENYYLLDVYSTVYFSEKIFESPSTEQKNYDTLGGWFARSPLGREARAAYMSYETDSLYQALLEDNFYFVIARDSEWEYIPDLYEDKGITVRPEQVEVIGSGEDALIVYRFVQE